jgi:predicted Zn-dependent protease
MDVGYNSTCPFHALRNQVVQGKFVAAESTLARWSRASPNDPNMKRARFGLAAARGNYAAAERYLRELQTTGPGTPYWRQVTAMDAASLHAMQGKLAQAEEQYHVAAEAAESRGAGSELWPDSDSRPAT